MSNKRRQQTATITRTHACEVCGYEVRFDGDTKVLHLPDGRHSWTMTVECGIRLNMEGSY